MKSFILKRRNKKLGHDPDGKLLTKEQIATFVAHPNLDKILDSLVTKKVTVQGGNEIMRIQAISTK